MVKREVKQESLSEFAHDVRHRIYSGESDFYSYILDLSDLCRDLANEVESLREELDKHKAATLQAANVASCLANGIKPD